MNKKTFGSDELLFFNEEPAAKRGPVETGRWKVMIVDDEEAVHHVTKMVLSDLVFEGKGLEFISAYSGEEAKFLILSHPDTAVLLLDVVMERDDSGLAVVRYIREILRNSFVRIVLRTGQPGMAPEEKVIVDYDINDYTEKTELTSKKLITTIISSLRSYRDIVNTAAISAQLQRESAERLWALSELRQSQHQLQAMMDNSPAVITVKDFQGRYLLVNRQFERLFHVDASGMVGKTAADLFPAEFADALRENDTRIFKTGKALEREETVPLDDGLHTYLSVKYPLCDSQGSPYAVCSISTDITERKRAEEALEAEKERLAVTLRSIGDGVITTDMGGRIILMNRVAEQLTGWSQKESRGLPLAEIFTIVDESTRKRCESPFDRVLASGGVIELPANAVLIARDGTERIIADSGAPIRDRESRIIGVVLVFRDITEKKRMEEEILRTQKLESIGVLAGGIAHDFNNLLTAILGYISLAKILLPPEHEVSDQLTEAENASLRARDLTQQLLTFSKGGAPVRKTASAGELIRDTTRFALSGSNVRCEFAIAENLRPVEIDVGQISRVIHNLVINADQAMATGGTIRIACDEVMLAAGEVQPLPEGTYLRIVVDDRGAGIPADHLPRIFDPYFTTKEKGKGLGLATAHSIIRSHDGQITVDSEPGVGTTFAVYLPVSPVQLPAREKEGDNVQTGRGRVLIMDDEEMVRGVAGRLLNHFGYEVTFARDGVEAIDLYARAGESGCPFDVVLMDLTIPGGMGGREAIVRLRELNPDVKAIASSGYSNDPIMADFRAYGFSGVLSKPYRSAEMAKVLAEVLGK